MEETHFRWRVGTALRAVLSAKVENKLQVAGGGSGWRVAGIINTKGNRKPDDWLGSGMR